MSTSKESPDDGGDGGTPAKDVSRELVTDHIIILCIYGITKE
jgi:hypothetical protein